MSYNERELVNNNLVNLFNMVKNNTAFLNDGVKTEDNLTDFEKLLRDTLILLNDNCENYITSIFNNETSWRATASRLTCKNNSNVLNSINDFYSDIKKNNNIKEALILLLYANTTLYRFIIKQNAISSGLFTEDTFNELIKRFKSQGGNRKTTTVKKINKKTILGKERCIYAIQGDRKEYLRYKGDLIPVKDYKKLMKDKK